MTKVYTKAGDGGTTNINGERVEKDSCLTETLGEFDSLMASIDKVIYGLDVLPDMERQSNFCKVIQDNLKHLAGEISGNGNDEFNLKDSEVIEEMIDYLDVDVYEFVRFNNPIAMDIDEARVRTRKVERKITQAMRENVVSDASYAYINRLSDYFFVLAVYIDRKYE